ncbi:MAG: glycosyltransferase [Candidatus Omnitrophica bacterium]|nr:glycosyltransferase [Candidatus Omnitrophota bacterium]
MKVGFKLLDSESWGLGSLNPGQGRNFIGDEYMALFIRKELLKFAEVEYCELFNKYPEVKLDILVYLNKEKPDLKKAKKHVVFFQNAYPEGNDNALKEFQSYNFDGYMFASKKLLDYHQQLGYEGIYLPFATDPDFFKPVLSQDKYKFEVAYVGNNIKGPERTIKYIYPAFNFNFGLFGNWGLKTFKGWPLPRMIFRPHSLGQISMDELLILYSSAKIILNCSIQQHADWDTVIGRIYDVMACNGFLISDPIPSAKNKFGDIIEFSQGGRDLVNKIKYYLKHEDERLERAQKGRDLILKSESYAFRVKDMLIYFKELLCTSY